MIEIKGTYNTARVFCDELEPGARGQIQTLCDQPFAAGGRIRIMPDVHAGVGCTIGTTLTIGDKVVPNLVGVDIGCGMETVPVSGKRMELERLDKLIYSKIPSGLTVRDSCHPYNDQIDLTQLRCAHAVNLDRARKSIGTLGGGNHFIELDVDDAGQRYLVIHSGSRHLGLQVAQLLPGGRVSACPLGRRRPAVQFEPLIDHLEGPGPGPERSPKTRSRPLKKQVMSRTSPKHLAYVDRRPARGLPPRHEAGTAVRACSNRKAMVRDAGAGDWHGLHGGGDLSPPSTTILIQSAMHPAQGRGVRSRRARQLLIPINMRDGSLLCVGKGNEDWNCSAPHGAGRLFSRGAARQQLSPSPSSSKAMGDIYTTSCASPTRWTSAPWPTRAWRPSQRRSRPPLKSPRSSAPFTTLRRGSDRCKLEMIGW